MRKSPHLGTPALLAAANIARSTHWHATAARDLWVRLGAYTRNSCLRRKLEVKHNGNTPRLLATNELAALNQENPPRCSTMLPGSHNLGQLLAAYPLPVVGDRAAARPCQYTCSQAGRRMEARFAKSQLATAHGILRLSHHQSPATAHGMLRLNHYKSPATAQGILRLNL